MILIRLLIFILFIYLGFRLVKALVRLFLSSGEPVRPEDRGPQSADLIRDPQCGIYFLMQRGVSTRIHGKTIYFCSDKCRDDYLKSHKSP